MSDTLEQLPTALQHHPECTRIIVHVGSNGTRKQQSEMLKEDFRHLLAALLSIGERILISGPIPTLGLGYGRFTRLFPLHSWLKAECTTCTTSISSGTVVSTTRVMDSTQTTLVHTFSLLTWTLPSNTQLSEKVQAPTR